MRLLLLPLLFVACDRLPPDSSEGVDLYETPDHAVDTEFPEDTQVDDTGPPCDDLDGDGFGSCEECDDEDELVYPGAPEICDGKDSNCDGIMELEALDGAALECASCQAAGYFPDLVERDPGDDLLQLLRDLDAGIACDYGESTDFLFLELDNHGGQVEGVYTGTQVAVADEKPDSSVMNTEHSWPRSQGAGKGIPECDLHHLYPAMADANSERGNEPFGDVVGGVSWSGGGSQLGLDASGDTVFEPRDSHKGNVARSMLYFAMRFQHSVEADRLTVYQAWSAADPVDEAEDARTFAIASHQGNVNAFVACPWLPGEVESLP